MVRCGLTPAAAHDADHGQAPTTTDSFSDYYAVYTTVWIVIGIVIPLVFICIVVIIIFSGKARPQAKAANRRGVRY